MKQRVVIEGKLRETFREKVTHEFVPIRVFLPDDTPASIRNKVFEADIVHRIRSQNLQIHVGYLTLPIDDWAGGRSMKKKYEAMGLKVELGGSPSYDPDPGPNFDNFGDK